MLKGQIVMRRFVCVSCQVVHPEWMPPQHQEVAKFSNNGGGETAFEIKTGKGIEEKDGSEYIVIETGLDFTLAGDIYSIPDWMREACRLANEGAVKTLNVAIELKAIKDAENRRQERLGQFLDQMFSKLTGMAPSNSEAELPDWMKPDDDELDDLDDDEPDDLDDELDAELPDWMKPTAGAEPDNNNGPLGPATVMADQPTTGAGGAPSA